MWGNARVGTAALVRPVKRSETRISTTASPETHQAGKHNAVANSLLHFSPFICYKQSTESSSVASRAKLSATLVARPASKIQEGLKAFNCPGHGTSFGKAANFRRVPSKQGPPKGSFLNFLSSVSGCAKCTPKVASSSGRKTILLRVFRSATRIPVVPKRSEEP